MEVSAWKNGDPNTVTGGGYGVRVKKADRTRWFDPRNPNIILILQGQRIRKTLTDTFWTTCPEIRGQEIGVWIIQVDGPTWPKGDPPKFKLQRVRANTYKLTTLP